MARSRKRKPRSLETVNRRTHLWWGLVGFAILIILLVAYANSSDNNQIIIGCYILFIFTIIMSLYLIRSGTLYMRGVPINRKEEPVQFWLTLSFVAIPLIFGTGFVIALHISSLFAP